MMTLTVVGVICFALGIRVPGMWSVFLENKSSGLTVATKMALRKLIGM